MNTQSHILNRSSLRRIALSASALAALALSPGLVAQTTSNPGSTPTDSHRATGNPNDFGSGNSDGTREQESSGRMNRNPHDPDYSTRSGNPTSDDIYPRADKGSSSSSSSSSSGAGTHRSSGEMQRSSGVQSGGMQSSESSAPSGDTRR